MTELNQAIARIQKKVRDRTVMNPCAALDEVEAFERVNGIKLPGGYREFLMKIGNGGGELPHYGLKPLAQTLQYDTADTVDPRLEFPLTDFWVWEAEPSWNEAMDAELRCVRSQGFLCLGTDGCGMHWILVITGAERGQMWLLTGEGAQPCAPRRDFLSWYEYWLDGGDAWAGYFTEFAWPDGKVTPRPKRSRKSH